MFFHAHPDDEAIFTGGTMARLAAAGERVVLVVATQGEAGASAGLVSGPALGRLRASETRRAAAELGVDTVHFLGYRDSGLRHGTPPPGTFAGTGTAEPVERLAGLLQRERAGAVVVYDEVGVYGHPDHVAVHRVGVAAAELAGVGTVYECTVDREYLHFVETHVVEDAARSAVRAMAAGPDVGVPTVLVDLTVDVRSVLAAKRAALAAHGSQLPAGSPVMLLDDTTFAEVYGWEWYLRRGPRHVLDALPTR